MAARNYDTWPRVIGKRGVPDRRVVIRNGEEYHVTKGWRGSAQNKRKKIQADREQRSGIAD